MKSINSFVFLPKTAVALAVTLLCALMPLTANATFFEEGGDGYYTIYDESGAVVTYVAGDVYEGDGYISGANDYYVIQSVDGANLTAVAQNMGKESMPAVAFDGDSAIPVAKQGGENKIAIYVTHSDESYEPGDGKSSDEDRGGIFDVAEAFKSELEARGVTVVYSDNTHHPHDSAAYRRSRSTAIDLLKSAPSSIIDIHRDGIPDAEEYKTEVDGKNVTKLRLLVGRSNPNKDVNREFAKKIKAVADELYPNLVKDIFIGKGNYNQELAPHSVLLEFGTHTSDKEAVIASTPFVAEVIARTVFGTVSGDETNAGKTGASSTADPEIGQIRGEEPAKNDSAGTGSGIAWIIGVVVVGALGFLLYSRGTHGFWHNVSRSVSETTGGLIGKRPEDDPPDRDTK